MGLPSSFARQLGKDGDAGHGMGLDCVFKWCVPKTCVSVSVFRELMETYIHSRRLSEDVELRLFGHGDAESKNSSNEGLGAETLAKLAELRAAGYTNKTWDLVLLQIHDGQVDEVIKHLQQARRSKATNGKDVSPER